MENYIFGIRPLIEYIGNGGKPEKVLIQQGLKGSNFHELFSLIRNEKIPFQMVPTERLNKFKKHNHQGIVAFIPHIAYLSLDKVVPAIIDSGETPLLVLLDGITDVRNMGAIARSAECAGAHAIVIADKNSAPVNAEAIKASAGALSRIPVCKESGIVYAVSFLKACGINIVALDDRARQTIYEAKLSGPLAVVMGSEDRGISPAVKKLTDTLASIPMKGHIASLNVSVATGIVLFEALRQRLNV